MANLLGQNIGTNYKGILNLDSTINTPLDATLRAVTDGEGDASPLQLSTDAVSVGAISGARLAIKGSGTTSATTSLLVQNSSGTEVLKVTDDSVTNARGSLNVLHPSVAARSLKLGWGSIFATDSGSELTLGAVLAVPSSPQILLAGNTRSSGANTMQLQASLGVSIAASLINPLAQLHIKGSGTTGATTALLVQDSAGTESFKILDNGAAFIRTSLQLSGGVTFSTNTNTLTIGTTLTNITGNVGTLPVYTFSMGGDISTSNTSNYFSISKTISPSAGSANFRNLIVDYTINASGVQTGTATGIFLNATETNLNGMSHNLLDLQTGGVSKFKVTNTDSSFSGKLGIGTDAPTFNLEVKQTSNQLRLSTPLDIYTYLEVNASAGQVVMKFGNGSGTTHFINNYSTGVWASNKWAFGSSYFVPSAQLHVKGSGTTSATTSLLVQNSAGNSALTILDNLNSQFGGTVTSDGGFRSIAYFDSFQRVALNNGLNTNPQNYLISGGVGRILLIDNSEADFNRLQFGGTTSSFPSLKRNGTAIDVRLADDSNYALLNTGATFIKGSGTTFATTSLLVQNSAGADMVKLRDDGFFICTGNIQAIGIIATAYGTFGSQSYDPSVVLGAQSTSAGFQPPRMTTIQRNAIATPAIGLIVYDTTTNKLTCYNGTTWNDLF